MDSMRRMKEFFAGKQKNGQRCAEIGGPTFFCRKKILRNSNRWLRPARVGSRPTMCSFGSNKETVQALRSMALAWLVLGMRRKSKVNGCEERIGSAKRQGATLGGRAQELTP